MGKTIYGIYDDEEDLMHGIEQLQSQGVNVTNVQSPFPVHGIEKLLHIPRTRISICAFLYGITGTSLALLMMWYMMIHDWHINIGGKPNFYLYMNLPAFIPVTFESTVLCAAHGMFITFLLRSKLLPGVTAPIPHLRLTDDKFVMHVKLKDDSSANTVADMIRSTGASEIKM